MGDVIFGDVIFGDVIFGGVIFDDVILGDVIFDDVNFGDAVVVIVVIEVLEGVGVGKVEQEGLSMVIIVRVSNHTAYALKRTITHTCR